MTPATRVAQPRWWPGGAAAWALWTLTVLGIPVIAWLDHLSRQAGRPDLAQLTPGAVAGPVLAAVSAATVGAVLASRRPRHPVGWLLLVLGLSLAWGGVPPAYAAYGLLARPGALPAAHAVAGYWPITVVTAQTAASFVLLLTPTGSLPSPRWRWWVGVTMAAAVILLVALTVTRGPLDPQYQVLGGPFDYRGQGGVLLGGQPAGPGRHHPGRGGRSRVAGGAVPPRPWSGAPAALVAAAAALAVVGAVVGLAAWRWGPPPWSPGRSVLAGHCRWPSGRPSCAYRLYDLDRILSRTLAYGLLSVLLGLGYAAVVLGLGRPPDSSSLAVAAATWPASSSRPGRWNPGRGWIAASTAATTPPR